ncbi:MAG: twin-arginine translocation signal domain-containing protein [Planctomycetia bacterium]|nr:twin-arginine translocation signal domain-containing protein [Planctomycetia bacterium]
MKRRDFLKGSAAATLAAMFAENSTWAAKEQWSEFKPYPIQQITTGPLEHWGAYYDQLHFDPTGRYVVSQEVSFHDAEPTGKEKIRVGLVDLQDGNRWIPLGTSTAWAWQLGSMIQWIPGTDDAPEIVWNDSDGEKFISHVHCPTTGKTRTLPNPVFALSPDGTYAVFPDFVRLADTRPGYGYPGWVDKNKDVDMPDDAGLWKMDLKTGETKLLFSFAQVARTGENGHAEPGWKHWFNHLIVAPGSQRFLFLHRCTNGKGWFTRLMTANADGTGLFPLNTSGATSHLQWRDSTHILAYTKWLPFGDQWGFTLMEDQTTNAEKVGWEQMNLFGDGHCAYVPNTNNEWVLNDTYPKYGGFQMLYLFHVPTSTRVELGKFRHAAGFNGPGRVDLHPNCSRDGKWVLFDSCMSGQRQQYLLDISRIIGK